MAAQEPKRETHPEPDWEKVLKREGWEPTRIARWVTEQNEIGQAIARRRESGKQPCESGSIDQASGSRPHTMFMLDGGTFKHMIGSTAM